MKSKFSMPASKPRNPLVALARFRQAGVHGGQPGPRRAATTRELQRELQRELDALAAPGRPPSE